MRTVERDLDRILTRLRKAISEHGYTQLEVQEVLGWGRSYISQLLTKHKALRIEQILQILNAINVDPADFWAEIYQFAKFSDIRGRRGRRGHRTVSRLPDTDKSALDDLRHSKRLLEGVVAVLTKKNLITAEDLDEATRRFRQSTP